MWRRDIVDVIVAWVIGVCSISLLLTDCGTHPLATSTPHFHFVPPVGEEKGLIAEGEYARIVGCSRLKDSMTWAVKVLVYPDHFLCGSIQANGCTLYPNLAVNDRYFRPALGHEIVHWLLIDQGHEADYDHRGPVWKACQV